MAAVTNPEVAVGRIEEGREAGGGAEESSGDGAAVCALGGDARGDGVEGLNGGGADEGLDSVGADDEVGGEGLAGGEVGDGGGGVGDGFEGGVEEDGAAKTLGFGEEEELVVVAVDEVVTGEARKLVTARG